MDAFIPNAGTSLADTLSAFASGREVPGSGSANALIGALAAAVLASVAAKTYEHAGELRYRSISQTARDTEGRAATLSSELLALVDEDAAAFAPVVAIRREAKTLREAYDQDQAIRREIAATKRATEVPLRIAGMAIEITERALVMVESGFAPARGESYSALLAALTALDGSTYVALLNIKSITRKIETLNDPEYERVWLEQVTTRLSSLSHTAESLHDQERVLRGRYCKLPA